MIDVNTSGSSQEVLDPQDILERLKAGERISDREARALGNSEVREQLTSCLGSENHRVVLYSLAILSAFPYVESTVALGQVCKKHALEVVRDYALIALLNGDFEARESGRSIVVAQPSIQFVQILRESVDNLEERPQVAEKLLSVAQNKRNDRRVRAAASLQLAIMGWASAALLVDELAEEQALRETLRRWCAEGFSIITTAREAGSLVFFDPTFVLQAKLWVENHEDLLGRKHVQCGERFEERREEKRTQVADQLTRMEEADRYAACPCASGKKFKFCCYLNLPELRMEERALQSSPAVWLGFETCPLDMPRSVWLETCRLLSETNLARIRLMETSTEYGRWVKCHRLAHLRREADLIPIGMDVLRLWGQDEDLDYRGVYIRVFSALCRQQVPWTEEQVQTAAKRLSICDLNGLIGDLISSHNWTVLNALVPELLIRYQGDAQSLLVLASEWYGAPGLQHHADARMPITELIADALEKLPDSPDVCEAREYYRALLPKAQTESLVLCPPFQGQLTPFWRSQPDHPSRQTITQLETRLGNLRKGLELGCDESALPEGARQVWEEEKAFREALIPQAELDLHTAVLNLVEELKPQSTAANTLVLAYVSSCVLWVLPQETDEEGLVPWVAALGCLVEEGQLEHTSLDILRRGDRWHLRIELEHRDTDWGAYTQVVLSSVLPSFGVEAPQLAVLPLGMFDSLPVEGKASLVHHDEPTSSFLDSALLRSLSRSFTQRSPWGNSSFQAAPGSSGAKGGNPSLLPTQGLPHAKSSLPASSSGQSLTSPASSKASKPKPPRTPELTSPGDDGDLAHLTAGLRSAAQARSVSEALEQAGLDYHEDLWVWESARTAAREARFIRPAQVYQALKGLAELAREYRAARQEKRSMGGWYEALHLKGLRYRPHESDASMERYGEFREFRTAGGRMTMQQHVTLGGASNCLQIYFELVEDRIAVGYCGNHLPCVTTNT